MKPATVLVLGCDAASPNADLKADEKALEAQGLFASLISTGSTRRNASEEVEIDAATSAAMQRQVEDALEESECKVIKIGALLSEESMHCLSGVLQQRPTVPLVFDNEAFFKALPEVKGGHLSALRKNILPSVSRISTTVKEAKLLLDDAGIPIDYPKDMQDLEVMADALRQLGPKYAMIKREILDEEKKSTTLHYVLCGGEKPQMSIQRFENPKCFFGASYSINPAIAAYLAQGHDMQEAITKGFKFAGDMLEKGDYFAPQNS